jgi:molecular chaperone GrpE
LTILSWLCSTHPKNRKKPIEDFLKQLGIEEIKTVGEKFNPEFHEAASHEEKEGFETDTIFEEVKAGYTLHGKVIYPAKVKVAK